jgi:hypothetical protein
MALADSMEKSASATFSIAREKFPNWCKTKVGSPMLEYKTLQLIWKSNKGLI